MTIDVPNEYEDVIRQAVASGAFADEQSALRHALQLFAEQQLATQTRTDETAFEAFSRLGVIGCMQAGPSDLATNPQHMDGFGR